MESSVGNSQDAINKAENFDELYVILDQIKELQGTKKTYTASELKDIIEQVRGGVMDSVHVTRAGGLRGKVEKLLNIKDINLADNDGFFAFKGDPVACDVLERVSLEYLKTQDKAYFDREYTGELDDGGFLIRKDGGKPLEKPSMNIGGGKAMQWVIEKVKAELNQ